MYWPKPSKKDDFILYHILAFAGWAYFELIFWVLSFVHISVGTQ